MRATTEILSRVIKEFAETGVKPKELFIDCDLYGEAIRELDESLYRRISFGVQGELEIGGAIIKCRS